jgi:hypothetical protein
METKIWQRPFSRVLKKEFRKIKLHAPPEKQRPILWNLIKFIEINPMKLKIGLFAPVQTTGTDGSVIENSELKGKEGKLLPFSSNLVD